MSTVVPGPGTENSILRASRFTDAEIAAVEASIKQFERSAATGIGDRVARGRRARVAVPHEAHAELPPRPDGVDPVDLLQQQAASRVPELVPVRYGRMLVSPFTFFRGGALIMADDLGSAPNTGLHAQLCGDAHVSNFGLFASYDRRLVFDVNDFDETLPGPFEWDLKRLVASIDIAGRDNGFPHSVRRSAVMAASKSYRKAMRSFTDKGDLDLWYTRVDIVASLDDLRGQLDARGVRRVKRTVEKSQSRDRWQAARRTTEIVDGHVQFRSEPPLLVPLRDIYPDDSPAEQMRYLRHLLDEYAGTLGHAPQHLLSQYTLVDAARKVVGVGSVGTRAWIFLLEGADGRDPLVLQAKEAQVSVLDHALTRAADRRVTVGAPDATRAIDITPHFSSEGERVVHGQRVMQAGSDVLLGWRSGIMRDGIHRDYYVRQLRDWKGSFEIEQLVPNGLEVYGKYCAWILARSHARSGDRFAIDAYLSKGRGFDEAIADFARAYADRNELDYAALSNAADSGRVEVIRDV